MSAMRFDLAVLRRVRDELVSGLEALESRKRAYEDQNGTAARYAGDLGGLDAAIQEQRRRLAEHDTLIAVEEALSAKS